MRNIFARLIWELRSGKRPSLAVEIASSAVIAGSAAQAGKGPEFASASVRTLGHDFDITAATPQELELLACTVQKLLDRLSMRGAPLTIVVPDTSARVFLLDFDVLPDNPSDVISLFRFRLRKLITFDVDRAQISYQVLSRDASSCRVVIVVMPLAVLEAYEQLIVRAGYKTGAILPSGLAALTIIESTDPVMTAHLDERSLTTSIVRGTNVLLYRTIDLSPEMELRTAEIERAIAITSAYFEDALAAKPLAVLYSGSETIEAFAQAIDHLGISATNLLSSFGLQGNSPGIGLNMAGVMGALAGAR